MILIPEKKNRGHKPQKKLSKNNTGKRYNPLVHFEYVSK
jgi:hypothetical protein